MVNKSSQKKSPANKNTTNKKVKPEHKERKLEKTAVDREDNTLLELDVKSEQNKAVAKLEEKAEVNLVLENSFNTKFV